MDGHTFEDSEGIATWSELDNREPAHARVAEVDLVVVPGETEVFIGDGTVDRGTK